MSEPAELSSADLAALVSAVGQLVPAAGDADRIERIRQFENLKAALAAAQAAETTAFVASQQAAQAAAGEPPARVAGSPPRSRWRGGSHRGRRSATPAGPTS